MQPRAPVLLLPISQASTGLGTRAPPSLSLLGPARPCFDLLALPSILGLYPCRLCERTHTHTHTLSLTHIPFKQTRHRAHIFQHMKPRYCLATVVMIMIVTGTSRLGPLARYSGDCALVSNPLTCTAPLVFRYGVHYRGSAESELKLCAPHKVRTFGRPESLDTDFAAQYRSVPSVYSALAWAASYRVMGAQPPGASLQKVKMRFLRLSGGRPGIF